MRRKHRRYTDTDRANTLAALEANGGNVARTSRDTNISASTIRDWRDTPRPEYTEVRAQQKQGLAEALRELATQLAHTMMADADTASFRDRSVAFGIIFDKLQLLEGQPTEITKNETHRVETPERAIKAAATALERRGLIN